MPLRAYNTLTRQKEPFETVQPGKVGMYVCGPTVYKPSHVGHMVGPVIFDTIKRYLTYLGYQVTLVVNITDIDDKIIDQAQKQKKDWKKLAEDVTAAVSLPSFDNSSMDGYAVQSADTTHASERSPLTLPVTSEIAAGDF